MTGSEAPATLVETHLSVLVFIGDRVYKLKKPLDFGFVDFTSREARHHACEREVELNRRLAPTAYLGVATVVDPEGAVADHLVVMRRMPEDRRLSRLVTTHAEGVDDLVREVASLVARFHRDAERSTTIDEAATPSAVLGNWQQNFEQLRPFVGTVLDTGTCSRIESLVEDYLAGREALLRRRIADGHVCDGHGDLQADDVYCVDEGPQVLDCLEFSDRLRHGDTAADVAFLAMDLERLGAPDLARAFLERYGDEVGEHAPPSLLHHYIAYRAHVRAKVNCLRSAQLDGPARAEAEAAARSLVQLCVEHLEAATVRLILVGGLPGTGKSTLASALGVPTGAVVIRSDEVRKELAGLDAAARAGAAYGEGLYDEATTDRVYAELLARAAPLLDGGRSVVLDASWVRRRHREAARSLAADHGAHLDELCCVLPGDVAAARIEARTRRGTDASDATPAVAAAMAELVDPWPEAVTIDTAPPPPEVLARSLAALGIPTAG